MQYGVSETSRRRNEHSLHRTASWDWFLLQLSTLTSLALVWVRRTGVIPELHLPPEHRVRPTARMETKEVRITAEKLGVSRGEQRSSPATIRSSAAAWHHPEANLYLVWNTSVKSCSRNNTLDVSLWISFT